MGRHDYDRYERNGQSHWWHGQPGMRNETVAAALAAAASLVIRRTSDRTLPIEPLYVLVGLRRAGDCAFVDHPQGRTEDGTVNGPNLLPHW